MAIPLYQVDAFTDRAFAGNPAAVVLLPDAREAPWMQSVAAEMNLSETAFLLAVGKVMRLRWFTPTVEVDLCGHATLASAHVLFSEGLVEPSDTIRFATRSGILTATWRRGQIELDFPSRVGETVDPPPGLTEALGVRPLETHRDANGDLLVLVEDAPTVRDLAPDLARLLRAAERGIIVTAPADAAGHDFVSRFFAPAVGVPEDPVTGSAHCALGPFWRERLGRNELVGYQASARGGTVVVRVDGERVVLGGSAVTIMRGELLA
jgi:PhzF family phenazine biosynthesis protein